jgi:hypothetical protein
MVTIYSMLLDLSHLKLRKTHYLKHLWSALTMATRVLLSGLVLVGHAIIPWIRVPKYFHILSLSDYLYDCDDKIHTRNSNE